MDTNAVTETWLSPSAADSFISKIPPLGYTFSHNQAASNVHAVVETPVQVRRTHGCIG